MCEELSRYAVSETSSRGRRFTEKPHQYRSEFDRDRDRIIHCEAFRRLEGKTQVFTPGLNGAFRTPLTAFAGCDDHYRTRLTHSIEVAQIARTIARALQLNESLTEAICLAHDLGHCPFGHIGEEILDRLMAEFGQSEALDGIRPDFVGFEHNCQTLRIVDLLEHPYPDFAGLNLMYETRLGLAKHRTAYDKPKTDSFSEPNCSLEGQVADIADRIAYNCHDLEDGMRAGLISAEQLRNIAIFAKAQCRINADAVKDAAIRRTRTAKTIIDELVGDCIEASTKAIASANVKTVDQICDRSENLIVLSPANSAELCELEDFLLQNFYRHTSLMQAAGQVGNWLEKLFEKLCRDPKIMPDYFQRLTDAEGLQRTVCDYIAGMTDRFCLKMLNEI